MTKKNFRVKIIFPIMLSSLCLLTSADVFAADAQKTFPVPTLTGDLVVRVGNGGITQKEWFAYKVRYAKDHRTRHFNISDEEKETVFQEAVDDELLFQEALRLGYHTQEDIRKAITQDYISTETLMVLRPKEYSQAEVQNYYETHKNEFWEPPAVSISTLPLRDETPAQIQEIRRNPSLNQGWLDGGWLEEGGDNYRALFGDITDKVMSMKEGEVSDVIYDTRKHKYLFWVQEKRPAALLTLEEAEPDIRHTLTMRKQAANEMRLLESLEVPDDEEGQEDALFEAALEEGRHRLRPYRFRIINNFVADNGKDRDALLEKIKNAKTFKVERLAETI